MDEHLEYNEESLENKGEEPKNETAVLSGLDKKRKWAVAVLAFLAVVMIISWSSNLKNRINDPFAYKGGGNDAESNKNGNELSQKDTDGDGLSDSDELNIYGTSPYLEDSDSDGFSDFEEVSSGNNPNCASGEDCNSGPLLNEDGEDTSGLNALDISSVNDSLMSGDEIDMIRTAFEEAGYDKDKLATMSDEDIYQLYDLFIQVYASGEEMNTGTGSSDNTEVSNSDYVDTIRNAYKEAGYNQDELDEISDEDLIKAYQEALKAYENNQ